MKTESLYFTSKNTQSGEGGGKGSPAGLRLVLAQALPSVRAKKAGQWSPDGPEAWPAHVEPDAEACGLWVGLSILLRPCWYFPALPGTQDPTLVLRKTRAVPMAGCSHGWVSPWLAVHP